MINIDKIISLIYNKVCFVCHNSFVILALERIECEKINMRTRYEKQIAKTWLHN